MRAHLLVEFGGRTENEEGTIAEVRLGAHRGFGLLEGPPFFAVIEVDVPGGDEPILEAFGEELVDVQEQRSRRFKLDVAQLSKAQKDEMKKPGPTVIPWGQVKAKMKDKKAG